MTVHRRVPRVLLPATVWVALLLSSVRVASAQANAWQLDQGTAQFSAQYTFGSFSGTTTAVSGRVSGANATSAQGSVLVMLDSLATGNGTRDKHMREALETVAHPTARFATDSIRPLVPAVADSALLFGTFTVRGVTRPLVTRALARFTPATASQTATWRIEASFPVTLAEHGITKGISRFFGTVKVGPVVEVSISALFTPVGYSRASSRSAATGLFSATAYRSASRRVQYTTPSRPPTPATPAHISRARR